MKRQKFIGRLVSLYFGKDIKKAKIVGVEFHQELKKPVFHLRSELGHSFDMTRDELMYYQCSERF